MSRLVPLRPFVATLALTVTLAGLSVPAPVRAASEIVFTSPAAEMLYQPVGAPFSVSWQEAVESTTRSVTEERAALDGDGGCATVSWQSIATTEPIEPALAVDLVADRCYRWTVTLTSGGATYNATSGTVRTLKAWTGTYNLYRKGVFSTQLGWDWCVAASVQMMLNIIRREKDHSRSTQRQYYRYARANDLTPDRIPGADPRGWALAMTRFGGGTYTDVAASSYRSAIRRAAKRMRLTGRPVGVLAQAGNHAMVLNGFSATADPAVSDAFEVTAVYVMGPLWPDRPKYDPPPNSRFTFAGFKRKYFFRYRNPYNSAKWSVWEGAWVTVNP